MHQQNPASESVLIETPIAGDIAGVQYAWLEITSKCNLECMHCYTESSPARDLFGNMSKSDWLRVISELAELGCKRIQFIGGEPTIHPDLKELITHAQSVGIKQIEVFSNATTVTDEWVEFYKSKNISFATSFYSSDDRIHELITKRKGSFEKTVHGISSLVSANIPVRAALIDIAAVEDQNIDAAKEKLNAIGVKRIGIDQVRTIGRGSACVTDSSHGTCGNCWRGKLCFTSSGNVYPCIMSRHEVVGNALNDSVKSIVSGQSLFDFRTSYREIAAKKHSLDCPPGNCMPNDDACGPDNCMPNDEACGPDNCTPNDA